MTVTYDIAWTGSGGYTMTGQFSFDSAAGDEVRDYEVSALSIDVLQDGTSLGTWTLPTGTVDTEFNFNFDARTGSFLVGGNSSGEAGQNWNNIGNVTATGAGFASGTAGQLVSLGSTGGLGFTIASATALKATLVTPAASPAPEPATWAMMIGGFGLVGGAMRRRQGVRAVPA